MDSVGVDITRKITVDLKLILETWKARRHVIKLKLKLKQNVNQWQHMWNRFCDWKNRITIENLGV